MNLDYLHNFLMVTELGSNAEAARRLGLSPTLLACTRITGNAQNPVGGRVSGYFPPADCLACDPHWNQA